MSALPKKLVATSMAALLAVAPAGLVAQETTGGQSGQDAPSSVQADNGGQMAAEGQSGGSVEGQITMQGENTVLANDLIGATVFTANQESVGAIEDLIMTFDGQLEGAVIGVGGFLGIGRKPVAVTMDSLTLVHGEDGNVTLETSATREDLENAEQFVSAEEQEDRQAAETGTGDTGTGMDGTGGGQSGKDTGETGMDTNGGGQTGGDTGETGMDANGGGQTGGDTGDTGMDADGEGQTGGDTSDTGMDANSDGQTGGDTGETGTDANGGAQTGGDTGDTGTDANGDGQTGEDDS